MHASSTWLDFPGSKRLTVSWRSTSTLTVFKWDGFSYGVPTFATQSFSPSSVIALQKLLFPLQSGHLQFIQCSPHTPGFHAPPHPLGWCCLYHWLSKLSAHQAINGKAQDLFREEVSLVKYGSRSENSKQSQWHVQKKSKRTASWEGEKLGLRISVLAQGKPKMAPAPGLTPQSCGERVNYKEGRTWGEWQAEIPLQLPSTSSQTGSMWVA